MRHLDLFSGIGGFALAARWMGWETVKFVEIDKFCQKVLTKNFPNVPIHGDIKTFNGEKLRGTIDIITGGFPCQPYSTAGNRKGTKDDRHLWPEMLRIIGEIQPRYVLGENVYGLINWSRGLVFEQIQIDLENKGYEVAPIILPACGTNAWHRRDRIWFVAHLNDNGRSRLQDAINTIEGGEYALDEFNPIFEDSTNTKCIRFEGRNKTMQASQKNGHGKTYSSPMGLRRNWERDYLPSPTICRVDDGIPDKLDRIRSLGNAIVPQVAYEIFKAIESTNQSYEKESQT